MKEYNEIGAANAMFNLACVVQCEPVLSGERVHLKILSYLMSADKPAKNAYLRVSHVFIDWLFDCLFVCLLVGLFVCWFVGF